jgi:hypothetical protein
MDLITTRPLPTSDRAAHLLNFHGTFMHPRRTGALVTRGHLPLPGAARAVQEWAVAVGCGCPSRG